MDLPYKFSSKEINLRKIKIKDVNKLYVGWLNDKDVAKHTDLILNKHSLKSTREYVKSILNSKTILYGIFYITKSKKYSYWKYKIGPILRLHRTAQIGYIIGDKRFWNKNVGTIVIKKLKKFVKKNIILKRFMPVFQN